MIDDRQARDRRYCCTTRMFRRQLIYLRRAGFRILRLDEVTAALRSGAPAVGKYVAITFDDGYRDNFANALPILKDLDVPATLFAVTGRVGETDAWRESHDSSPRPLASWNELREMADHGIEIGSHTVSHPSLPRLDAAAQRRELIDSKATLESRLGRPVRFFAYPYGHLDEATRDAVAEAGYEAACSTRSGFNGAGSDPYLLRRLEVYGTDSLPRFALKMAWGTNDASLRTIGSYYRSRVAVRWRRWRDLWT